MTTITVIEHRRIRAIEEIKTQFELRPEKGSVWLQRLCFLVLSKIGAFAELESVRVERHEIGKEGDAFMVRLMKSSRAIVGSFDRNPTECLIGPEDYAKLMDEAIGNYGFDFDGRYFRNVNGVTQVYGLKVRMIPWMRGILLL